MRSLALATLCAVTLLIKPVLGQDEPHRVERQGEIKALSLEEVGQYLAGAGMGGPDECPRARRADRPHGRAARRHERLVDELRPEARYLGARLVDAERTLDALFRRGAVGSEALAEAVRAAAVLAGEYRLSHLEAHRRTRAILTSEQVDRYDELRGRAKRLPAGDDPHRH